MSNKLDAIKGDLNTLARLLRCVDVAMEMVEEFDKKEQLANDHVKAVEEAVKTLALVNADVCSGEDKVAALEASMLKITQDTRASTVLMLQDRENELKSIIARANEEACISDQQAAKISAEIEDLIKMRDTESAALATLRAEASKVRAGLEGVLSRV